MEKYVLGSQFFHDPKYEVGLVFRALNLSIARPDTMRMLRPAGHPTAFCDAVSTTSSFQSSKQISSQPTLHTPSTTTNVSGLTLCASSLSALMSLSTPVLVSTCVMVRILYGFSFNAFSTSSSGG